MDHVTSRDGTRIAYDRLGEGPAVILVNGALSTRTVGAPLAALLAPHFTVFAYDRRGRGDSTDTPPFAAEREIEDLDAIIAAAGGSAMVFGHSSGAALAIEAAARGRPITKLALYEPPYIVDDSRSPVPDDFAANLQALVDAGRLGDAVDYFWRVAVQLPPAAIAQARQSPAWPGIEALGKTLPYDIAILGRHMTGRPLPSEWARLITIPALVLDGGASNAQLRNAVAAVVELLPHAERRTLDGHGHGAPAEVLALILEAFFLRTEVR